MPPRQLRGETVRRARLLDELHRHLPRRATLVVAPAGYGKTTLLAQFAAEVDALACWCTLDESDRDPRALLASLIAAIARRVPDFGTCVRPELAMEGDQATWTIALAAQLAAELHERVRDFLVLVLDDCHLIRDSHECSLVLNILIERMPEHCHFVLAGRSLPPLACLPRLTARREVRQISQQALRLDTEETAALLRLSGVPDPEQEHVRQLEAQTQGWAIAAALIASTETEKDALASTPRARLLRQARETLFAYLASEVLAHQPPALQDALLCAAVLPSVEVDRCAALLQRPVEDVRRLLATAESDTVFITQLDTPPRSEPWSHTASPPPEGRRNAPESELAYYRFHDLFRDFLLESLRRQQPVRYRWLERRASMLAEAAGDLPEAINHALAGHHMARAARLITTAVPALVYQSRWRTALSWTERLPEDTLRRTGALVSLWLQAASFLPRDEAEWVRRLAWGEALLPDGTPEAVEIRLARSNLLFGRGDYHAAISVLEGAAREAERIGSAELRARVRHRLASALARVGELESALILASEALKEFAALGTSHWENAARHTLAFTSLRLGHIESALTEYQRVRQFYDQVENAVALPAALNSIGTVQVHLGEPELAARSFADSVEASRSAGADVYEACAWLSLGDLQREWDALELAARSYEQAAGCLKPASSAYLERCAVDSRGQLHRLRGELDLAEILARQAIRMARTAGARQEEGQYLLSLGRVHLARGEHRPAALRMEESISLLRTSGARCDLARAMLWQAQLHAALGDSESLAKTLQSLEELLAQLGYSGFLIRDAHRAQDALVKGAGLGVAGTRLRDLLTRARGHTPVSSFLGERPQAAEAGARDHRAATDGLGTDALPQLQACGFGRVRVCRDGREVPDHAWRSAKSRELFFYLLYNPGWQRRERIVADVWGDVSEAQARSAFHSNAHRLRKALHPNALQEQQGRYRINPELRIAFDATELRQRIQALPGRSLTTGSARRAREALDLYQGPFLEGIDSPWTEAPRRELETLFVDLTLRLGRYHATKGQHAQAVELVKQALKVDPYLEGAHELLVTSLAAAGESAAAMAHFRTYVDTMQRELGEPPSARMAQIGRRLRSGPGGDLRLVADAPDRRQARTTRPDRRAGRVI